MNCDPLHCTKYFQLLILVTDTSLYLCSSLCRRTAVYNFSPVVACSLECVDDVTSPECGNCDSDLLAAAGDDADDVGRSTIGLSTNNTKLKDAVSLSNGTGQNLRKKLIKNRIIKGAFL